PAETRTTARAALEYAGRCRRGFSPCPRLRVRLRLSHFLTPSWRSGADRSERERRSVCAGKLQKLPAIYFHWHMSPFLSGALCFQGIHQEGHDRQEETVVGPETTRNAMTITTAP